MDIKKSVTQKNDVPTDDNRKSVNKISKDFKILSCLLLIWLPNFLCRAVFLDYNFSAIGLIIARFDHLFDIYMTKLEKKRVQICEISHNMESKI